MDNYISKIKKIIFLIIAVLIALPLFSYAVSLECNPPTTGLMAGVGSACYCTGDCQIGDIFLVGMNVFNFFKNSIVFPIVVLMIIYGGVMMIFSGGNTTRAQNGRKVLTTALVGFAIVVGVGLILSIVLMILTGNQENWVEFMFKSLFGGNPFIPF